MLKATADTVFDVRLYVADTSGDEAFFDTWYARMPQTRRTRCDRFRQEADRKRCITAYALLSYALNELTGKRSCTWNVTEGADGKPYLTDIPVFFNISHSGERIALALSPMEVGCDVESKSANALSIAKRFFSENEHAYILAAPDEKTRSRDFTRLWTMKESVVKCCGEGIRRPFRDFSVVDEEGGITDTVTLPGKRDVYHIREFAAEDKYCYSVCSIYDRIENDIRRIDCDRMI